MKVFLPERRSSFCTGLISRKLCRFLLMFSTCFTSFSVLLLFPLSITFFVIIHSFSISNDLTQIINFPTRIPDCDSHSPALLDLFLSSDASICSTMVFPPLGNSDHAVASVSIDFPIHSKQDTPFHRVAYDYSCADWDGLRDHLRDVPWGDIFKLSASAAATEFCEWVQVGIDVYIPHCKYQVKPHSSPWFSAACAAAIVQLHNISITPKMVKKVITNLDSSKSSGPDCIPVVVLKNCEPELSYILAKLFNNCLKESCFPDCWKVSSVVPVFKNIGERSTARNYRPVSLLSVVSKVFEKLVNNRIVDHLEKCSLFSDFQYGFRSSRSTADLLTVVSDRITRAFNRSGATRAVALDIPKAFNRVWHAGLLHKLKSFGISGQIFGIVSSFLSNRRLRVVLDGKSSQEYPVNAGILQGSILGPTLFLLYINDLPDDVICNIAIYADDTTLYSKRDQASDLWQQLELASELESDLRDTVDWGRKWLLDFNAEKTQLLSFDRSKNTSAINVKMDGSVLEEKTSFKMLGLTFSSKLDWGSYIVSIAKTASKKIGSLDFFYEVSFS